MAGRRLSLELLVTQVASALMAVDSSTMIEASRAVLRDLVDYFEVDTCFLRHHDRNNRTTVLVAEWPPRENIPDPDPLWVIHFDDADSVTAAVEHARDPILVRPTGTNADYQEWIGAGAGIRQASALGIPLLSGDDTTGVLGLVLFRDCAWSNEDLNALKAIAALFAQLQARVAAEEMLRHRALHDDLTGLLNRRSLIEHLEKRLRAGMSGPVAMLFLDLDRFKTLNDFLGHAAGDEFMQIIARRLVEHVGPGDMVARIGGDEFVVVPEFCSDADSAELATGLRRAINEPVMLGGETVSRGVTIGVAQGIPGRTSASDLMKQADRAVQLAKDAGGNDLRVFTDAMRSDAELRDDIELRLRRAVAADELVLHYQPEVDLRTGRVVAVEALVRWRHPTRGMLQPGTFIEVAEQTNLAGELGRWVMRSACNEFAGWLAGGIGDDLVLRINVSPVQLVSLNFADSVRDILSQTGIAGPSLCFEITEHAVVQDLGRTQITLSDLKEIGVHVAIDDFGTGYSSLSHLKSLAVDVLKIDRSFVNGLGRVPGDLAIVKSIIGLADSFGLELVAEGVETPLVAETLRSLGCFRCQGFLFSRPLDPVAIRAVLAKGYVEHSPIEAGAIGSG